MIRESTNKIDPVKSGGKRVDPDSRSNIYPGRHVLLVLSVLSLVFLYSQSNITKSSTYQVPTTIYDTATEKLNAVLNRDTVEYLRKSEEPQGETKFEAKYSAGHDSKEPESEAKFEVTKYGAEHDSKQPEVDEVVSVTEESKNAADELDSKYPASKVCPEGHLNPEMFENAEEYRNSPYFEIPTTKLDSYAGHYWGTEVYEETYLRNPPKKTIPRLKYPISQKVFLECFMNRGFPVIFKMENLKVLGYKNRGYTLDEFIERHPTTEEAVKNTRYRANGLEKGTPNLGPGLLALKSDAKKKKMGVYRNYPRNMKLTKKAVYELGMEFPPYHNPRQRWQLSTMFMGSTTADTPLHGDGSDNFVHHFVGTKRWILAPPTESRVMKPRCLGGLCWSKAPLPRHPTLPDSAFSKKELTIMRTAQFTQVDVTAGEMLFLPSGWFHAVYNLEPSVSLVNWVTSGPSQVFVHETHKTGGTSAGKDYPCLPGMDKCGVRKGTKVD